MKQHCSKNIVILASTGRTGTRFLGTFLQEAITDCVSYHEPDLIAAHRPYTWTRVKDFGIYRGAIGKLFDRTGLRAIAQKYRAGSLSAEQTARLIRKQRFRFYEKHNASLIIEAYYQWASLLDMLPTIFLQYKAIGIVRDPRSWIASAEAYGFSWGANDIAHRLNLVQMTPETLGDHKHIDQWDRMGNFERLCWTWKNTNKLLLEAERIDENIRLFRFEDLFSPQTRRNVQCELLDFITSFKTKRYSFSVDRLLSKSMINDSRVETSSAWLNWSSWRCRLMHKHCGTLMREMHYGQEPEWRARVAT